VRSIRASQCPNRPCAGMISLELPRCDSSSCLTPLLVIVPQLLDEMNPPTKIIQKFLKTWGDRDQTWSQYSLTAQLSAADNGQEDAAGVALTLSRRLISIMKVKKILNIEAGLEIMALGLTISSEVCQISL
jgi:hypothetical protein